MWRRLSFISVNLQTYVFKKYIGVLKMNAWGDVNAFSVNWMTLKSNTEYDIEIDWSWLCPSWKSVLLI